MFIKIFSAILVLMLTFGGLSRADWAVGVSVGDRDRHGWHHDRWRWHEHPHWGYHEHFLPSGCLAIWSGGIRYYYCDGLYYTYSGLDYVLVNPPYGVYVSAIPPDFQPVAINGRTYYTNDGVYYVWTHRGYKVVAPPVVYAQPAPVVVQQPAAVEEPAPAPASATIPEQDSFTVNVPNDNGAYTAVVVKKSGSGYVGPQGEYYATFPTVSQLKAMYAKK